MKRLICLLLCVTVLSVMALPVCAASDDRLRADIIAAMETGQRLDISQYGLNREEMDAVYADLFHKGLLPWYADSFCDWTAASDGTIAAITLRDLRKRSFSEDDYMRAMAELIAETCHDGMTDLQKVLSVHDYIVSHAQYSYQNTLNDGYHALVKGETACYGYAQLFLRVMEELGIPCQIVICDDVGNGAGHAWNVVQVDGNWYHLDLTWDDPLPESRGRALHTYFMKTDREFRTELGHDFDWVCDVACGDNTFASDNLWTDVESPIIFLSADTAILRRWESSGSAIYSMDLGSGQETRLYRISNDTNSTGLSWWNDRIWFNSADAVYSMEPDGSDFRTEYTLDDGSDAFIYGVLVDDGTMTLSMLRFQGDDYEVKDTQVALTETPNHLHEYEASYVSATCVEGGYTLKSCSCGISYRIDGTAPKGHDFAGGLPCTICGEAAEAETVPTEPIPTAPAPAEPSVLPVIIGIAIAAAGLCIVLILRKKK